MTRHRAARSGARVALLAAVLALHGVLLLGWWKAAPPPRDPGPPRRVAVRWLAAPEVARPAHLPAREARATPPLTPTVAPRRRAVQVALRSAAAPQGRDRGPVAIAAPASAPTALLDSPATQRALLNTEGAQRALLNTEGTQRALRETLRDPGLAARAQALVGAPPRSETQQLGDAVRRGAKGDCLKGEYLGGGMGLLSVPFLAAAALREQCRR